MTAPTRGPSFSLDELDAEVGAVVKRFTQAQRASRRDGYREEAARRLVTHERAGIEVLELPTGEQFLPTNGELARAETRRGIGAGSMGFGAFVLVVGWVASPAGAQAMAVPALGGLLVLGGAAAYSNGSSRLRRAKSHPRREGLYLLERHLVSCTDDRFEVYDRERVDGFEYRPVASGGAAVTHVRYNGEADGSGRAVHSKDVRVVLRDWLRQGE